MKHWIPHSKQRNDLFWFVNRMQCPKLTKSVSNVPSTQFSSHTIVKIVHEQKTSAFDTHFLFRIEVLVSIVQRIKYTLQSETRPNTGHSWWLLISIKTTAHQFSDSSKLPNISTFRNWISWTCMRSWTKWQLSQSYVPNERQLPFVTDFPILFPI